MEFVKKNQIVGLLALYTIACIIVIINFDGTGGSGDSYHHYQFAKYAPQHPKLFLDHWAKPLYVLLASPFAQFGFTGIKVFNVIVSILTVLFTIKTARKLGLKNSLITGIVLIFAPYCFVQTFSGLTEPLFALFIIVSIYTITIEKITLACIVASFLPFIRSEGLIILGAFGLYLLVKRKWKHIPLLGIGHIVYSLVGVLIFKDILWVFTKIPYAKMGSIYGHGKLTHFVDQMNYVFGIPIYILFILGTAKIIWDTIQKKKFYEIQILVFLGFLFFFVAHTLFWYLGIFNSMGLKRVLIGVAPLVSIIALIGFNFVSDYLLKSRPLPKLITQVILIGYVIIFPFTSNPAAIKWKKDLGLNDDQILANEVASKIKSFNTNNSRYFIAHPYLCEKIGIDFFNDDIKVRLNNLNIGKIESGDLIIWDRWFSVVEGNIAKEQLDSRKDLIKLLDAPYAEKKEDIIYSIYKKK